MQHFTDELRSYKDLINIITVVLLLLLPITSGNFILFFSTILLLHILQFTAYLNADFSTLCSYIAQTLVAIVYIAMSAILILQSLYIIKSRLSTKVDISCSVLMSIVGIYSLYTTIMNPSTFTWSLVISFFIVLAFRWTLHFKASISD